MALNVQEMFDRTASKFGFSRGHPRAPTDFLKGCNLALKDIYLLGLISGGSVSSLDNNTSLTLDEKYETVLLAGIDYYMADMGYKDSDKAREYGMGFRDMLKTLQMEARNDAETQGKFADT